MSIIRMATEADGRALAEIYAPAVASPTSFELTAPDGTEMGRRVAACLARTPWLVYERDGDVVGYAYAGKHRDRPAYQWSVEVSAYVRADQHRRGVARALYERLFEILVRQGFRNAYAGITLPNAASVGLHLALGFTPIGTFHAIGYKSGAYHDTGWFERPLMSLDIDPPPPIPLPELDARAITDDVPIA